jgi:hypothetical protein
MRLREIEKAREYEFPKKDFPNESFHMTKLKFGKRKQQFLIHNKSGCPVGIKSCFEHTFQLHQCPVLAMGACVWHQSQEVV